MLLEMGENGTESNIMDRILKMDDEIIALSNWLTLDLIKEKLEEGKTLSVADHKTISDIANNSTKRKVVFGDTEPKQDGNKPVIIQI